MFAKTTKFWGLKLILSIIPYYGYGVPYWQCQAHDNTEKIWQFQDKYQRLALNNAYERCKKDSLTPSACLATKSSCRLIVNEIFEPLMWQCTALDDMAYSWVSDRYRQRNDAALGAKAYCEAYSGSPNSCYINLLTCKTVSSV